MSHESKSPLLKKRALDALLETMNNADYDSLGAHRRGEGDLPEQKGTELDSGHTAPVVIPAKDLAPPSDPASAEFFKESEPRTAGVRNLGRMYHGSKKVIPDNMLRRFMNAGNQDSGAIFVTPSIEYANQYKGTSGALYSVEIGDKDIFDPENDGDLERLADGYRAMVGEEYGDEESAMSDYQSVISGQYGELLDWAVGGQIMDAVEAAGFDGMRLRERPGTISGNEDEGFNVSGEPIESVALFKGPIPATRVDTDSKISSTIHSRPSSKAHANRCAEIAKAHPDWDTAQVEGQAELVGLGVKPIEDVLADWQDSKAAANPNVTVRNWRRKNPFPPREPKPVSDFIEWLSQKAREGVRFKTIEEAQQEFEKLEKEAREVVPVEDDIESHEFMKEAPTKSASGKHTHEEVDFESPSKHEGETCAGCKWFVPRNGCTAVENPIKPGDWCNKFDRLTAEDYTESRKKSAGKTLYHVTSTDKVPNIKAKGILPLQTSNWVKGEEGERYGEGEIFAMDNPVDAVRWASRMDWEFNKGMGTGKISIIVFTPGKEKWKRDTSDPMSQAMNNGKWLKAVGSVKPEQILSSHVLEPEMVKAVVQNKEVKLADVPTKSYGMGTPIGGTDNPDAGASDEPDELQDPGELSLDMTSSLEDDEYDPYDYEADDAKIAAAIDEEDYAFESQARLWASVVDGEDMPAALEKIGSSEDCSWFAKSARPSDQKVELLQKQFKMTPEQMEDVIRTDPSPNQSDFVGWIAKYFAKGAIKLPEDSEKIKGQLEMFQKFKKSPSFTFNKDIQKYDPATLFDTLEQASSAGMGSKKEQKRDVVNKGATVVVQEGDVKIYKVTTAEAASELGGGTNWCTAPPGNSYVGSYLKDGPLYIFFDSGSAVAQLHCETGQFMNRQDVCMLEKVIEGDPHQRNLKKFLADPALAKALSLLAAKEPKVEEWVKTNIADPEEVKKILGDAAAEEIEGNAEYDKRITEYESLIPKYEADLAEYEEKLKVYQPKYEEWQKLYTEYRKALDEWYENPEEGSRPERPEEPDTIRYPNKPRHPKDRPWPDTGVTKKFKRQVRNALATGIPLSPEIEAQFVGADVNTELLLKYGVLFHPGQPWEPLAESILNTVKETGDIDKAAIDYAVKFIKGRWPEVEPYLLDKKLFLKARGMERMRTTLEYAARVYKTRWPEFEARLMKAKPGAASGYGAAEYAISVLKQPWTAIPGLKRKKNGRVNPEECMIVGNPGEARRYAEKFFQGKRWEDFEGSGLKADNLAAMINYAADTLHARMPELEEKILSGTKDAQESKRRGYHEDSDLALEYAEKVIKGRWPEYEQRMLNDVKKTEKYSGYNTSEYKPSHGEWGNRSRLDNYVANYIKQVIKGRWPELEETMLARYKEHVELWVTNQNFVDGYLVVLNNTCQARLRNNSVPADAEDSGETDALGNIPKKSDPFKQKPYTKFNQDPQCSWPEGEKRLVTRDTGYEGHLIAELKHRATGKSEDESVENWTKDEKYISPEDLAKAERPTDSISYEERDKKPDHTVWNGIWIGWYGMDGVQKYVDYMLANGQVWEEGVDIMELHEDLEDLRSRYFGERPKRRQQSEETQQQVQHDPRQQELAFQSSLLRKKGLVEMQESPSVLPPRDDLKGHIDQQEQDLLTKDVRQGVVEPLNPKKKVRRPQIDPRINPDGIVASKTSFKHLKTPEIAAGALESFFEMVNEGDREDDIYDFADYLKSDWRADTPEGLWDEFETEAVRLYRARKGKTATAQEELPPEPGTGTIPAGAVRCFHYTEPTNLPSIRQQGLLKAKGRGDDVSYSGPSAGVWASTKTPTDSELRNHYYIEFWAMPDDISHNANYPPKGEDATAWGASRDQHVILRGDAPPDHILAIHEPWHVFAHYLEENWGGGIYEDIKSEAGAKELEGHGAKNEARAVRWMLSKLGAAEDVERDQQAEYSLEQVEDTQDEAKRFFMQEDYIKQLCNDSTPPKTMEEMWDMFGEEYTAEFYGYPYKRVPDFTDQEVPKENVKASKTASDFRVSALSHYDKATRSTKYSVTVTDKGTGATVYTSKPEFDSRDMAMRHGYWVMENPQQSDYAPNDEKPDDAVLGPAQFTRTKTRESKMWVRIRDKETDFSSPLDVQKATRYAESLSKGNPGERVFLGLDEDGAQTESVFVNGRYTGETIEKFAFQAAK